MKAGALRGKKGEARVSWKAYHRYAGQLGRMVRKDRFSPNIIVCISRGGLPVGVMLSEILRKPLGVITVQSYKGKKPGKMRFDSRISAIAPIKGRILLVDDLVDTGRTLKATKKYLLRFGEVRTAVLMRKICSAFVPDYYVKWMPADKWIVFPYHRT